MTRKVKPVLIVNILFFLTLAILGYLSHRYQARPFFRFTGACLSLYASARLAMLFFKTARAVRNVAADGFDAAKTDALLKSSMPGWIRGYYEVEKLAYRNFFEALTLKPLGIGHGFALQAAGTGPLAHAGPLFAIAALCCIVYGVIFSLQPGFWWAAGSIALACYVAVWIIGDWRALRKSVAIVSPSGIELVVGLRTRVFVQWEGIDALALVDDNAAFPAASTLCLTPGKAGPLVAIRFKHEYRPRISNFGYAVAARFACLTMAIREPAGFMRESENYRVPDTALAGAAR